MDIPVNFQRGDKQRSGGKGASVITTSLQLQEFTHAWFRQGRGEDGVDLRSQHTTLWADVLAKPGLPGTWVAPLSPFPHSYNALIFPSLTPLHVLPAYIPYTSTAFCLGASPQPSFETRTLARQGGRQSTGQQCQFPSPETRPGDLHPLSRCQFSFNSSGLHVSEASALAARFGWLYPRHCWMKRALQEMAFHRPVPSASPRETKPRNNHIMECDPC